MYASPERLWHLSSKWHPTPEELGAKQAALGLRSGNDFKLAMAIVALSYHRTDWPTPRLRWSDLSAATGMDRRELRNAAHHLDELDLVHLVDNGPSKAYSFNLCPLIMRIAIMRQAAWLELKRKHLQPDKPQPLQLPGLEDADNPNPQLVADVVQRMSHASAAQLDRFRKAEPPDQALTAQLRLRRGTRRTGPVAFNPTYGDSEAM
jgi:hypothetical protein